MIAEIKHTTGNFKIDLTKPIDISIPLEAGAGKTSAWYVPPVTIEPVRAGGWVGSVAEGGSVNFRNIYFNPHGHGTHTECVGHITKEWYSVYDSLKTFFFIAKLITVTPEKRNDDFVITEKQIKDLIGSDQIEALIIRTLPNDIEKMKRAWSNTNPPYIEEAAAKYICEKGILHLLIDLPSVDREVDEGKLLAHRAFWNYPAATRINATITEFIYVPQQIDDGNYLLNLQVASFVNDASPSRPLLYRIL